jgi:hypothetical protein
MIRIQRLKTQRRKHLEAEPVQEFFKWPAETRLRKGLRQQRLGGEIIQLLFLKVGSHDNRKIGCQEAVNIVGNCHSCAWMYIGPIFVPYRLRHMSTIFNSRVLWGM